MALGLKPNEANLILNALFGGTAYQGVTPLYIQLHTADPGIAGTTAVANSGRRVAIGTMTAAANGACSNTATITFAAVASTQTYTDFSAWTSATAGAGAFVFSGTCTGTGTIGQDFVIAVGDLDCAFLKAA